MKEVYALKWSGTGVITRKECFTDLKRAQEHLEYNNKRLKWRHRILGHQWVLVTLKVKEGPRKEATTLTRITILSI